MPERVAVFVTDTLPQEARAVLGDFVVHESQADDGTLAECEALICWPRQARGGLLLKMKKLKMVQTLSAGVDTFDFASLPGGAQVYSNAGAFTESVAEHAWGMLLGVAKGIHLRNQRTTPRRLRGKTLLVLGAGAIGSEVARLSKSLGMKTVGVSRSFRVPEAFDERYPLEYLRDKIPEADAVVMALPLTNSTRGLMSHELLSRAKEAAIIVNVGRAESVPEDDLVAWLGERPESRFATDVFWVKDGREVYSTPAWQLPNFAGTLHISGVPLGEDLAGMKVAAALNVRRYFETGSAANHVDVSEYI
ncbi:MAG: 3-phosphoglycerate dehydrogenase [Nitrososphaerota archaeon]|nr:3-phosphoglycerate dehydrogenase [Nitrososphaerota archaeon]